MVDVEKLHAGKRQNGLKPYQRECYGTLMFGVPIAFLSLALLALATWLAFPMALFEPAFIIVGAVAGAMVGLLSGAAGGIWFGRTPAGRLSGSL